MREEKEAEKGLQTNQKPEKEAKAQKESAKKEEKLTFRSVVSVIALALLIALLLTALVEYIYATKYDAMVEVKKKKGGAAAIEIAPTTGSLDFGGLPLGGREKRYVTLENKSNRSLYIVVWIWGGISPFIKVNKDYFVLKGKEKVKLTFFMTIPPSANISKYKGTVYIFRLPLVVK